MGRMADARKRARREDGAAAPAAPEAELVFPAEPAEAAAADPAPGASSVSLPASGLAEDILRQLEAPAEAVPPAIPVAAEPVLVASAPAPAPAAAGEIAPARIELPASGLAEDILGRADAGGHSLSFFAAPAQEHRAAAEATEHLVTFYLDREEYGVDVRQVQEIRRLTEITTVPRAPEFIRGVINLRGRILPVLDLKRKLGLGEVEDSRAARIVVVRVRERLIGLLVDGASQVPKIPVSRIEPPPEEVVERGGDYIRGVAKLDDRLIILVDLERLLAHELKAAASPAATGRATVGQDGVS